MKGASMLKRIIAVMAAAAVMAGPAAATAAAPDKNIVETAAAAPKFQTLVKLVKRAGLAGTLSRDEYTVFAPTDRAFSKVPRSTLNMLMNNRRKLRQVLLYHVIVGKRNARSLIRFPNPQTAEGSRVKITTRGTKAYVNGRRILRTDIRASNGIIHPIGGVLIPPSL
jgi:uncharacterized surface protein with fasciclin (FAS1) repeats